jgi:hypothetical protein
MRARGLWAVALGLMLACGGRGAPGRADGVAGKGKHKAEGKPKIEASDPGSPESPTAPAATPGTARPFSRSVEHQVALRACAAVPCTAAEIGAIAEAVRAPTPVRAAPVCRAVSFLDDPARSDEHLRVRATVDCEQPGATREVDVTRKHRFTGTPVELASVTAPPEGLALRGEGKIKLENDVVWGGPPWAPTEAAWWSSKVKLPAGTSKSDALAATVGTLTGYRDSCRDLFVATWEIEGEVDGRKVTWDIEQVYVQRGDGREALQVELSFRVDVPDDALLAADAVGFAKRAAQRFVEGAGASWVVGTKTPLRELAVQGCPGR